jgi:hypothetical protein
VHNRIVSEELRKRIATLTSGDQVPLEEASHYLTKLRLELNAEDQEWEVIPLLRQKCLGEELDPWQVAALRNVGLVNDEGTVDATLKSVVLASVRGDGKNLHIESPFVKDEDRALSEFIVAREQIRRYFDEVQVQQFFAQDPIEDTFSQLKEATKPPPMPNRMGDPDYLKRLLQRAEEAKSAREADPNKTMTPKDKPEPQEGSGRSV